MMRTLVELVRVVALLTLLGVLYSQAAFAQSARKFTNKPITVRLCPGSCRAVNGHGLRPGGNVSVYESRGGWARVSAYLNRAALVPSFGNKITKKPALWVPVASLATNKPAVKPPAKKAKTVAPQKKRQATKRVSVIDRIARLRRIPSPVFRPANGLGNDQPVQATVTEPVTTTATNAAVSESVENAEPVKKPVVVETTPVTSVAKGTDSKKVLTWEEVQAKIAAQAAGKSTTAAPVAPTEADTEADKAKQAEAAAAAKAAETAKAKQAEAAAAAKAAETAKAKQAEAVAAAKAAEAAKAKKAAEENARIAAEAKKKLEEQAKAAEAANKVETAKVAVVLPPKKVEPAVVKTPEPTFKSAKADPITLGARPKKLTKKLLDKRLKKLPGSKSKTPKKVVIALRHYALGLLDSGECKGIERGGASAVPGMLYVACSDDPTYLRQFPLEEESW